MTATTDTKPKRHYYFAIMGCYSPQYGYEEVSAYELNERKQAIADLKEYRIANPDAYCMLKRRWELIDLDISTLNPQPSTSS